jgi:hypothetical protein
MALTAEQELSGAAAGQAPQVPAVSAVTFCPHTCTLDVPPAQKPGGHQTAAGPHAQPAGP